MSKYKILKSFKDKKSAKVYEVGEEVDFNSQRAKEIIEKLKTHGGGFIELVKESKPTKPAEPTKKAKASKKTESTKKAKGTK